jgi:hypothetical protein
MEKKQKKPVKSRKQFPPEMWVTIRQLYESGRFASLNEVYAHLKKQFDGARLPSLQWIRIRAAEEGWNKRSSDAEIAEKKAKSIGEVFEHYGMGLDERIRRNVIGIKCVDDIRNEIFDILADLRKRLGVMSDDEIVSKKDDLFNGVIEKLPSLTNSLRVSLEYLKNSQALCGDNAPEKRHIIGSKADTILDKFSSMTDDELDKVEERLKRVNGLGNGSNM